MIEKHLLIYHGNFSTNPKHKFLVIHIGKNEMTKVDCNAFLSESEPGNLSLFYHFGGEYSLVPWIVNVRNSSKQRF